MGHLVGLNCSVEQNQGSEDEEELDDEAMFPVTRVGVDEGVKDTGGEGDNEDRGGPTRQGVDGNQSRDDVGAGAILESEDHESTKCSSNDERIVNRGNIGRGASDDDLFFLEIFSTAIIDILLLLIFSRGTDKVGSNRDLNCNISFMKNQSGHQKQQAQNCCERSDVSKAVKGIDRDEIISNNNRKDETEWNSISNTRCFISQLIADRHQNG